MTKRPRGICCSNYLKISLIFLLIIVFQLHDDSHNEELFMDMSELCLKYGFILHQHEVTTEDGYILSLFRLEKVAFDRLTTPKLDHTRQIQEGDENLNIEQTLDQQQSKKPKPGKPVLFIHGNNQTPENWLLHGINSPAFILGNEGYDVWLGANRGCKFSNKHAWLQHQTNESHADDYWRFSWQEMGQYDLPAFIDKIKQENPYHQKVGYIGLSQGVGQAYYAFSGGCTANKTMQKYFRDNISVFISLATTVKFYNVPSVFLRGLSFLATKYEAVKNVFFGMRNLPEEEGFKEKFCHRFTSICQLLYYFTCDDAFGLNDYNALRMIFQKLSGGTSMNSVLHPLQLAQVDRWKI
eukprot:403352892